MAPGEKFSATVTDIRLESRIDGVARWQVALDHTLFSTKLATGFIVAVSPTGARLEVPIPGVIEDDGTIWHVVDKPLAPGTEIVGTLAIATLEPD